MTLTDHLEHIAANIRDQFSSRPVWPDRYAGAYLGMGARDPVFTGPEHSALVIGPPRSGKTSSVVIPAVAFWAGPVVTTSTKYDIATVTNTVRRRQGQTWVYDPTGQFELPRGGNALHWSPLLGCADWDTAIDRAWILTNAARPDPAGDALHWTERAAALLAPLLHAAALGAHRLPTVLEWIHRRETWHALDELSVHTGAHVAHDLLAGIADTDSRELSGIWSTADSVLAAYRTTTALAAADQPNFDPMAFARSSDTVHIVIPGARAAMYAPIVCALLDQIRAQTLAASGHWPMLWALDEIANVAPLPNLPAIAADAGSQGLILLPCLQDLSQARQRWGHQADGLLTLFATTLLLPGIADPATLGTVTTLAGKVDRPQRSVTRRGFFDGHTTISTQQRPLLPESVIAHGKPGHALHLRGTHPTWLRLTPWHQDPWLTRLIRGEV